MIPYLDAGFLITLLIKTPGTQSARETLQPFEPPFVLNLLHQLQIENFLARGQIEGTPDEQRAARDGERLWRHYRDEGVFQIHKLNWEASLRLAIAWNQRLPTKAPPSPLLLLHPALAAITGGNVFLSFDPRSRHAAISAGLQVLPGQL